MVARTRPAGTNGTSIAVVWRTTAPKPSAAPATSSRHSATGLARKTSQSASEMAHDRPEQQCRDHLDRRGGKVAHAHEQPEVQRVRPREHERHEERERK